MYCIQCGKELPEGSSFCDGCGAALGEAKSRTRERSARKGRSALIVAVVLFAMLACTLGGILLGRHVSGKNSQQEPVLTDDGGVPAPPAPDPDGEGLDPAASPRPSAPASRASASR